MHGVCARAIRVLHPPEPSNRSLSCCVQYFLMNFRVRKVFAPLSAVREKLYAAAQASIRHMRAREGRHVQCLLLGLRSAQVVRPPPRRGGRGTHGESRSGRVRWRAGGRRGVRKYFWGGFVRGVRASARAGKIFFKSFSRAFWRTHGGGRCFRLLDRRESSISASFS